MRIVLKVQFLQILIQSNENIFKKFCQIIIQLEKVSSDCNFFSLDATTN